MRLLITGIGGFAGSHLAEHCLAAGDEVFGLLLAGESRRNIEHLLPRLDLHEGNVTDAPFLAGVVASVRPEGICHLAGMASVGDTWGAVDNTLRVNALATVGLLTAARNHGSPRVLVIGSGEMYGSVSGDGQPLTEETPLRPLSPYALSKLWQEEAALFFHRVWDLPVLLARPFNHTGPRQSPRFVASDFARQIAAAERTGGKAVLSVGNLTARRDFLDVRDVAAAYRALLVGGRPGRAYNIASGRALSIRELLDRLLGLARVPVAVEEDPRRLRPADIPLLSGDASRLARETGWRPSGSIDEALADLLDYWRGPAGEAGA